MGFKHHVLTRCAPRRASTGLSLHSKDTRDPARSRKHSIQYSLIMCLQTVTLSCNKYLTSSIKQHHGYRRKLKDTQLSTCKPLCK